MKPLILDFTILRKKDSKPIYKYNTSLNLNTINFNDLEIPFIKSKVVDLELVTKTKIRTESDDIESDIIEASTHTEATGEKDDIELNMPELITKTRVDREKDDENGIINYQ